MLVKICGVKNIIDAKAATKAGADFLGLNFVPTSKRLISVEAAKEIIEGLGNQKPKLVGVFQNQPVEYVNDVSKKLGLDYVQLHGDESPEYCAQMATPVIKAFGLDADFDVEETADKLRKYKVEFIILDRKKREVTERERGNTKTSTPNVGNTLNSQKVAELAKNFPIILAGGLTPENVREAVNASGDIKAVDVAGGVETEGNKDPQKIKAFIVEVK